MDLREVFATNLRRLRHEKGLSQDDLAYEAEISRIYLAQLEKGVYYASLKIVGQLADALRRWSSGSAASGQIRPDDLAFTDDGGAAQVPADFSRGMPQFE